MPYFVVVDEQGPAWNNARPMRAQEGWDDHARFMDALVDEKFVVLGGPLGNNPKHRALLIFDAPDEQSIRHRMAQDPWMLSGMLRIAEIHPWKILLDGLSRVPRK